MQFIITIDTEGDNQWSHGCELSTKNLRYIPRFQELCNRYSIRPTYLVTSEVCEDDYAKEMFSKYISSGIAEIGAHLHAWTTPPFVDKTGFRYNDNNHAFASELEVKLMREKLTSLTNQIEQSFGKRPTSFRSGRYGFSENVAQSLADLNYIVDSSVTPFCSWATHSGIPGGIGGPDFIEKSPFPYQYSFLNNHLIEIPVTILPTSKLLKMFKNASFYYFRNVDKKILFKLLRRFLFRYQPLWLRPFEWMNLNLFDKLLKEAENIKLPFVVMMFHSSELMPGCSIYRKDEVSIENLYRDLEDLFILLKKKGIDSLTLSEAALKIKT